MTIGATPPPELPKRAGEPTAPPRPTGGPAVQTPTDRPGASVVVGARSAEHRRLDEAADRTVPWRKWGPYLSERQWGTVREDYSESGDAWNYFTHDQARSRAYRWGEDGIAGISDDQQRLCLAVGLWNGRDPILKERLFGLTNSEGNHGEDVKEYYFYLDNTPTHSYMRYLYRYPHAAFPYTDLVETNRARSRADFEYELIDTGVFDDDRYFDVVVEYAKAGPEDLLAQITVTNRGPERSALHLLPQLWFRDTWSGPEPGPRPLARKIRGPAGTATVVASHPELGDRLLYCEGRPELLFTENETNTARIFGRPNATPYVKDAFHRYLIHGEATAVNPANTGTRCAAHYRLEVPAGGESVVRLRLGPTAYADGAGAAPFGGDFAATFAIRRQEADAFYAAVIPPSLNEDARRVVRQAFAGMLWSKQYYYYDVDRWLEERGADPLAPHPRHAPRNDQWFHMVNADIVSVPDKWEYPWYASWDLAFHLYPLAFVDLDFAKEQLALILRERYLHPNGQIPAYEWNFGDVNPPVQAWATVFLYGLEKLRRGEGDIQFLEHAFHKLALNFTWWVNRKDPTGRNVFEGGFLGLDNIGVFDRSAPLPTGGRLEQADGTAWVALFSQNMLEMAIELALHDPVYEDLALKFFEHFLWVASAMDRMGERHDDMWDEEDGFFYDLLRLPDGSAQRLRVRSMVGLLPLCAATVIPPEVLDRLPSLVSRGRWFMEKRPELIARIAMPDAPGYGDRRLLAVLDERKLRRVLARVLDEAEFLSPFGIRSLSRYHADHPYVLHAGGRDYRVAYLPAESNTGMFGGNSNWRGPIWLPVNGLIIRALLQYYVYYGDDFTVECPTGSGRQMTLYQVAEEITRRLARIFLRDQTGRRPVFGGARKFQNDPNWRDDLLFYEYFHGDNGAGLGASHQTGWTGMVAGLLVMFATMDSQSVLTGGQLGILGGALPRHPQRQA